MAFDKTLHVVLRSGRNSSSGQCASNANYCCPSYLACPGQYVVFGKRWIFSTTHMVKNAFDSLLACTGLRLLSNMVSSVFLLLSKYCFLPCVQHCTNSNGSGWKACSAPVAGISQL